ncbi:hypothetical protein [Algisphaera agarilytica]|uniref:Uncharacterized protein n=1 Tax=Algisphaera agarilytica TaxID=1385975 RepID=A0A7X0LKK2_9BACT|nr:hypothetical protein [Algisphaera agarilytica]MBB6429992.1 hypothetical protein [Algisphaera agarilytica]
MSKFTSVFVFLLCATVLLPLDAFATPPAGRLAIMVDGNFRDADDIAATPVTLAMLISQGHADRLVHYSHSCDLRKKKQDAEGMGPDGLTRQQAMQDNCDGTAARWGQFPHVETFFNCITQQQETIDDLTRCINDSTAEDPLWFILAGEPDLLYQALVAAQPDKRQFVYVITHHPANHRGDDYGYRGDYTSAPPKLEDRWVVNIEGVSPEMTYFIGNQNKQLYRSIKTWNWARDHEDERINWLYERIELSQRADENGKSIWGYHGIVGKADVSDTGMVWYWTSGLQDEACTMEALRDLFEEYVSQHPAP